MHDGPEANKEKRQQARYDFPATIEYQLDPPSAGEVYRAVTVNISTTGMGAFVFSRYPEGQKIIITTSLPVGCRKATVRWIKKENKNFFLVGLKFIDHSCPSA